MSYLLGIEVSSKQLRYLVFSKKDTKKFLVTKQGAVPLEGPAPCLVVNALLSVISREKITFDGCYVTFFRDDMVNSELVLPQIPARELEEIVRGEIGKIPSLSNKEFYFTFSHRPFENTKTKIIFSAVPKDIVGALCTEAQGKKLRIRKIELAPLNLLCLLYQLNKGKDEALIILDENTTAVAVGGARACKLLYSISTGKSALYRDNKLDSGELMNWTEELRRAFKSFALSYNVENIRECWLVWDGDRPGLEENIESRLGIKVKNLGIEMFPGFGLIPGLKLHSRDCIAAAPVIADQNKYKSEFRFDRLVREQFLQESQKRLITVFAVYACCVTIVLGSIFAFYANARGQIKNKLVDMRARISELENKTRLLREKRDEAKRSRELLILQAGFVRDLNRISWSRVFGEIAGELPPEVSLSSFRVSGTSAVELKGEALTIESVAGLVRRIETSKVLQKAKFDFLKEAKRKDGSVFFTFGILASIRKDGP